MGAGSEAEFLADWIQSLLPFVTDPEDVAELQDLARKESARAADPSLPDAVGGHGHIGGYTMIENRATRRKIQIK